MLRGTLRKRAMRFVGGSISFFTLLVSLTGDARERSDPLSRRVQELQALVSDQPRGIEQIFSPSFLQAIPPANAREILRDYFKKSGPVSSVVKLASKGPYAADYRFFTQTKVFSVQLTVGADAPHLIQGLWFGPISPNHQSLAEVTLALKALPGQVSFAVCRLDTHGPKLLDSLNPDQPLALGSTFKLYVLGALLQAISKGERRWDEVVKLRQEWKSWPCLPD